MKSSSLVTSKRACHLLIGALLAIIAFPAIALELIMVEQKICPYCEHFHRDVDYNNTVIGKQLPLRPVQLSDPWPEDLSAVQYDLLTPTFILVEDGKELGRLRGYPGKDEFWFLLKMLLDENNILLE